MGRRQTTRRLPLARRAMIALVVWSVGFALGFGVPYVWTLDRLLQSEMAAARWTAPTRVYARSPVFQAGMPLTPARLERLLISAGYRPGDGRDPGTYSRSGQDWLVTWHGRFPGAPATLSLSVAGDRLVRLEGGTRLEPPMIGTAHGAEGALPVSLGSVPPVLLMGLQAVEDRGFKHHAGLSPRAILRALWANLRQGAIVQGGSTLTQQLTKTLFLTRERRWLRKFHEAVLASLMEWRFDKDVILEAYLNEVFMGQDGNRVVRGMGSAAEYYFGLPLGQLEVHQHALLVAVLRGPSYYHPWRHPDRARARRDRVLQVWYETGIISSSQRRAAQSRPLSLNRGPAGPAGRYPAYFGLVHRQARLGAANDGAGLHLISGMDLAQQSAAEAALTDTLAQVEPRLELAPGTLQGAVVVLSREDGAILAAVGDRKPRFAGFNRVRDARRPVGSLVKPFLALAALRGGHHLASLLQDEPFSLPLADGSHWSPDNFDGQSRGPVRLVDALARSYNQAMARLGLEIGVERVAGVLTALGLSREAPTHPSMLLGALELSPLEVGQLYLSLLEGAQPMAVHAVLSVMDERNRVLYQAPTLDAARPDPDAWLVRHAMQRVVSTGTARGLGGRLGNVEGIAAKTGTSNGLRDAWFLAADADRVVVVWIGRDDNGPAGITGASAALPVAAALFERTGWRGMATDPPPGVVYHWVDADGRLADEDCPDPDYLPFRRGAEPEDRAPCARRRSWWPF